jgi:hypothetical protein
MAKEFNVAEGVDAGVEETADGGRGFVLDDNSRAGDEGSGQEGAAGWIAT